MDKKIKNKKMFPEVANFRKCLLKTGDEVRVITGSDKGKIGKVIDFDRKRGKIKVSGIKMMTHFQKKEGENGGIIKLEGFIDVSNVMFLEKNKITRLGRNEKNKRVSKKTGVEV